jgi:hypothetical protein
MITVDWPFMLKRLTKWNNLGNIRFDGGNSYSQQIVNVWQCTSMALGVGSNLILSKRSQAPKVSERSETPLPRSGRLT